jgi:hypothetical protein
MPSIQPVKTDANDVMEKVRKALETMQYGEITIKVNAGKIVVADKLERERLG